LRSHIEIAGHGSKYNATILTVGQAEKMTFSFSIASSCASFSPACANTLRVSDPAGVAARGIAAGVRSKRGAGKVLSQSL